jgi:hypothetical protein
MNDSSLLLVEATVGLCIVGLYTIPAISSLARQLCRREPKKDDYEDSDGKATTQSLSAFSNKWTAIFILVFAGLGLGCQIMQSVLSSIHKGEHGMPLGDRLLSVTWVRNCPNKGFTNWKPLLIHHAGAAFCPGACRCS